MIKSLFFSLFCVFSLYLQCQEVVLSFKNEKLSRRIKKDSYTIINEENNNVALIIIERKDAIAYLFDENFNNISAFQTSNIKFNKVLGYKITENKYSVVYTNDIRTKFALHQFDFNSETSQIIEIELNLTDDELFLDAVSYNNALYVLSGNNNSELSIRLLNSENEFELLKTFHLDKIGEDTALVNSKINLGSFALSGTESSNITKIDSRVPNSIERASNANKLYQDKETLIFSFDVNKEATILYTINLDLLSLKVNSIPYPKAKMNDDYKKYNSFIFENKIFQIACSRDEMAFVIEDYEGNLLKDYYVNRDMSISFKNSPIIQEGTTALPFITSRKLEQTTKYLRKVSSGKPGINVQKVNGLYYITLGGYKYVANTVPMVGYPNMSSNGFTSYNPTFLGYTAYTSTKSTYFNTILNFEFEHIKGKVETNMFDRVSAYKKNIKYITAEDVFYFNDKLYFGYFNLKESEYNLVRF
ncbi:hypothetical protein [Winogradskyella sp.]|uniref:hypothetical protein n=1 Tax=Winogradskyella sp. TaxID=1883156 RepID=UPI003F6B0F74